MSLSRFISIVASVTVQKRPECLAPILDPNNVVVMASLPGSIAGFTVLPILYPSSTHMLYARLHVGSQNKHDKTLPEGRTLFLVNVPPDATERELILLFRNCGTIEKVVFDYHAGEQDNELSGSEEEVDEEELESAVEGPRKRRKLKDEKNRPPTVSRLPSRPLRILRKTGGFAHIVFLDSSSVGRALSTKPRPWPTSSEEPSGLAHYEALYESLRPPLDTVREYADSSIALYEFELAKSKQKSKYRKGEAIVDEDGFTLVTRGGAYGKTPGGGVRVASKKFQQMGREESGQTKKAKEKEGFYSFQKAEKQRRGQSLYLENRRKG
jgi:ribosomal RNA-processing protein 7